MLHLRFFCTNVIERRGRKLKVSVSSKTIVSFFKIFIFSYIRGGSICNDTTLITQPIIALEFFTVFGTKDQDLILNGA